MNLRLAFTPAALAELENIFRRIAQDDPKRALTYVNEIRAACEPLCRMPLMGVDRADLRSGLRTLPLWRRVVVAYEIKGDRVDILGVFSNGQDYEAIMGR